MSFGDGGSRRDRNRDGNADFVGHGAADLSAGTVSGTGFTMSGVSFPLTLNPGQTATLTVQLRSDRGGRGERRGDADQQLVDAERHHHQP